jgi:hypothetical protein
VPSRRRDEHQEEDNRDHRRAADQAGCLRAARFFATFGL